MRTWTCLAALALSATAFAQTQTAVPFVLNHNGRLLDASDKPVDGSVSMTFELHDTDNPNEHEPRWSERHDVQVFGGSYSLVLGDTGAGHGGTAIDTALLQKSELFLSVRIGDAELLPRMRVTSVPYALRTAHSFETERVLADGVDTAALKDGAVTLAKLQRTNGKMVGLDSDTLDGLDSSAFAPAAIEGKIDSLLGRVGTPATDLASGVASLQQGVDGNGTKLADLTANLSALDTKVGTVQSAVVGVQTSVTGVDAKATSIQSAIAGLDTKATGLDTKLTGVQSAVTGVDTKASSIQSALSGVDTKVSGVQSTLGSAPSGSSVANEIALLRTAIAGLQGVKTYVYSRTCDDFATNGWASKDLCLHDGRWHEVLTVANRATTAGTIAGLRGYIQTGADVKVTTDNVGTSWPLALQCANISQSDGDQDEIFCSAQRRDDGGTVATVGNNMEFITYSTKGTTNFMSYGMNSGTWSSGGGGAVSWTFRWWVRF